jgi:CcmD family protein
MGPWGFVFLAYGIVWGCIVIYLFALKRRCRCAEEELMQLRATEESSAHGKK